MDKNAFVTVDLEYYSQGHIFQGENIKEHGDKLKILSYHMFRSDVGL
jgi:hypothetical protein